MPTFLLSHLNEDCLHSILLKFEYKTGIKLYRTTKWIKAFVSQKQIRWHFHRAVLRFSKFYYKPSCWLYEEIWKDIAFTHRDTLRSESEPIEYNKPIWLPVKLAKFRTIQLYGIRDTAKMTLKNLRDSVWKDLAAQHGVYQLIVSIEVEDDALLDLIRRAKPKLLSVCYLEYTRKYEFYKNLFHTMSSSTSPKYLQEMQFRFVGLGPNRFAIKSSENVFEYCGYRKRLVFHTYSSYTVMSIIWHWLGGADVGNVEEVEINKIDFSQKMEITEKYYDDIWVTAESYKETSNSESIATRAQTAFGKDILELKWLEEKIILRFY